MKNIIKNIALSLIMITSLLSCEDRYGIDSQEGTFDKTLTVISDSVYYFESENPREVIISMNSSSAWTCLNNADWCNVTPSSSDSSSLITDITIILDPNTESYNQRTATLVFSSEGIENKKVIEIVQNGLVQLDVDTISETFAEEGETKTFSILSNRDFAVYSSSDWLEITPDNGLSSEESQTITVTASSNIGQEKRSATIFVQTKDKEMSFVVKQAGNRLNVIGDKELLVSIDGSDQIISLDASSNWTLTIPSDCDWITSDVSEGTGSGDVTLKVAAYDGNFQRKSYVYFESSAISLKDSVLIIQKPDPVKFTSEFFNEGAGITFNDDGSATLYANPGSVRTLKSKINNFSYGKYTINFSDFQIAVTSSTMLMSIAPEGKDVGGISLGVNANPKYSDGWSAEYWITETFGSKIRQRVDNDISRDDISKFVVDVRKSDTEGIVDIDFYINDELVKSDTGIDGFASGDPYILTFWIYNVYDKENPAVFEPATLIYEPY